MIYLVGGAPRVGKTQLVKRVIAQHPMHAISTDAIRYMIRRTVPKRDLPAELFLSSEKHIAERNLSQILKDQNAESDSLWPYVVSVMESYAEDGYDLLVEGVAVLPSLVNALDLPHSVVIIGNRDPSHAQLVAEVAANNQNDWLHHRSSQDVETYGLFFSHMSDWLQAESKRYHVRYVEFDDSMFEQSLSSAAGTLLG